jgi:hypothetical protein
MFCTNCGTQQEDGLKFCTECGERLDEDTDGSPAVNPAYTPPARTAVKSHGLRNALIAAAVLIAAVLLLPATNYEIGIKVQNTLNSKTVRGSGLMGLSMVLGAALTGLYDDNPAIVGQRFKLLTEKSYIPRYAVWF